MLTMAISLVQVIIPCLYSINMGILKEHCSGMAMSIVPMTGKVFSSLWSSVIRMRTSSGIFVVMPPSPTPNILCFLEDEDYFYAILLKGNNILYGHIEHLLTRPVGRPPKKPIVRYHSFQYKAASWSKSRRVMAKIEWHSGELFPRIGFIVTNLRWKSSNVVKFYNKRGTAEQRIKEGKYALRWTRLSCHDFVDNQVRLQLFALAYNLGNFFRRLALPKKVRDWSLRTLKEKMIRIGAKVVRHSRYVIFQMAEVAVPRALFCEILERIKRVKPIPIGYG